MLRDTCIPFSFMPRKPRNLTPLRQLREALGKTQKEFSAFLEEKLALPPNTYRAYEMGTRALSPVLATQLMILMGVDPDSLLSGGPPKTLGGREYSSESCSIVRERERNYSSEARLSILA